MIPLNNSEKQLNVVAALRCVRPFEQLFVPAASFQISGLELTWQCKTTSLAQVCRENSIKYLKIKAIISYERDMLFASLAVSPNFCPFKGFRLDFFRL